MGLQKYRSDTARAQPDGATVWSADWMGGTTVSKIENCRLINLEGDMRRTVYITGDPDSFFSTPAACKIQGATVKGYVTGDDGNLVFHHVFYS
jgi:hypothetical protein